MCGSLFLCSFLDTFLRMDVTVITAIGKTARTVHRMVHDKTFPAVLLRFLSGNPPEIPRQII